MTQTLHINNIEDLQVLVLDIYRPGQKWTSSAENLDKSIVRAGYKIKTKFFHCYNLPVTKENLEINILELWAQLFWENHLKYAQQMNKSPVRISDELRILLSQNTPLLTETLNKITKSVKATNPELQNIPTLSPLDQIHFLRGVAYGYPPESISFFVENYKNEKKLSETLIANHQLKEKLNIDAGFLRILPDQMDDLTAQLLAQGSVQKKLSDGKENIKKMTDIPLDQLGRPDPTGSLRFMMDKEYD